MQELVLKKTLRRDGWCVLDGEDLIFQFNESILLAGDKKLHHQTENVHRAESVGMPRIKAKR